MRTWLGQPLIAKDDLVGYLVLARSIPDAYPGQARLISRAYANQVAIAIHNAQLYQQAGDAAALEERNRLARELHDSVAQALYSISLFVDATRMALKMNKPEVVESHLEELSSLSREAMSDMRLMIFELRPPILEKVGLIVALQSRLDAVETRAGFQASFHSEGKLHLSAQQESELYRIIQEALNNVIKHAQASHVGVQVVGEADWVRITVEDNGVGFELESAENGGGKVSEICMSGQPILAPHANLNPSQAGERKLRLKYTNDETYSPGHSPTHSYLGAPPCHAPVG